MIKRFFYPVGQGAFYSEKHTNYNIVYDCGTEWKNRGKRSIDKVITQNFSSNDEIDILFISHFDYDHISKIENLKNHVKKIKKVVMPLLHDDEKKLLIQIYEELNFGMSTLISNPEEFFGDETSIITVSSVDNNEVPRNDNIEPQEIDEINTSIIDSGTILKKEFNTYTWVYIPYNHIFSNRNKELEKLLSNEGIDVNKLKNDPNYVLKKVIKDRKIIRDIYDKLDGNVNQNSMILYSGIYFNSEPYKTRKFSQHMYYHHFHPYCSRRVSCIYTGDADLNVIDLKDIFKKYWDYIGTIQIPHHGDLKSFNENCLVGGHYCCPISVGENNSYGHPSYQVIADIMSNSSFPILVTENLSSGYVEHIRC